MRLLFLSACTQPVTHPSSPTPGQDTAGQTLPPGVNEADTAPADTIVADTAVESISGEWSPPTYDPDTLPSGMRTVNIEIEDASMARLDSDPWGADDERGVFVDGDGVRHEVDLSYRGAYALLSVMNAYDLRNWKVKFDDDDYRGSREWNLNYEPHFRQKLAYDLFRFAGVAVPGPEHVVLKVNGEYQGMYLEYEDPDSTGWLQAQFGEATGDLYKAAYDLPHEPQCFALLTWLGTSGDDYRCHYSRKRGEGDSEFSTLIDFVDALNNLSDADFADWVAGAVDVDRLLSYLVVSNFIANWDSYPQRPKNYWLYSDESAGQIVYIPWDLDATFSPDIDSTFNQMGATASVLYNLLQSDYAPVHAPEGTARPLVRRLLAIASTQQAYIERYAELSQTILSADYLLSRHAALTEIVSPHISSADRARLDSNGTSVQAFIQARAAFVADELAP